MLRTKIGVYKEGGTEFSVRIVDGEGQDQGRRSFLPTRFPMMMRRPKEEKEGRKGKESGPIPFSYSSMAFFRFGCWLAFASFPPIYLDKQKMI
jgi:hypothetical protein